MSDTNHTFTIPMTRARLEELRSTLTATGFQLAGDVGEAKHKGVTIAYTFHDRGTGDDPLLELSILKKSFLASMLSDESIEKRIRDYFTDREVAADLKALADEDGKEGPPSAA